MDHNKIIATVAQKTLKPLGLVRDGHSRVWRDDRGWWGIIVEFQPSGWSKGCYLNVGACFLVYESQHFSFDVGHREKPFAEATNEVRFTREIQKMADHAAKRILELRNIFRTPKAANSYFKENIIAGNQLTNAAMIAIIANDLARARKLADLICSTDMNNKIGFGTRQRFLELQRLFKQPARLMESVLGIVMRTRAMVGFESIQPDHPIFVDFRRGTRSKP
jgi:hypothetical protein